MRAYSVAEVRAAEAPLLEAGAPLMRRAAEALAGYLAASTHGPVVFLVGAGDNGGDALYAAAELGDRAVVARTGDRVHDEAWAAAVAAGVSVVTPEEVPGLLNGGAVLVDGMRGIGGSGAGLRGVARETALSILPLLDRTARPQVVAVDVPSGIDADTGEAGDAVLPADVTLTFGAVKRGLLLEPAKTLAGDLILIDIGLGLPED